MTKILVCGGRKYGQDPFEEAFILNVLRVLHKKTPITCVVHGGAKGADSVGGVWAHVNGVFIKKYLPDWDRYGRSAGHRRNADMLKHNPDIELVVAFPGGEGTAGMVKLAKNKKIEVYKPEYEQKYRGEFE